MAKHELHEPFADFAPYIAWSLPTDRERSVKRQSSTMAGSTHFIKATTEG
jgi:hypothetical protein